MDIWRLQIKVNRNNNYYCLYRHTVVSTFVTVNSLRSWIIKKLIGKLSSPKVNGKQKCDPVNLSAMNSADVRHHYSSIKIITSIMNKWNVFHDISHLILFNRIELELSYASNESRNVIIFAKHFNWCLSTRKCMHVLFVLRKYIQWTTRRHVTGFFWRGNTFNSNQNKKKCNPR